MANIASKKRAQSPSLSFASEEFDPDQYAAVAKAARLRQLSLIDSAFNVKPECYAALSRDDDELQHGFGGECSSFAYDAENGSLFGVFEWVAEIKLGRKKALKVSANYMLIYTELEVLPEEYVRLYFEKIGKFSSYPYFRSHFAMHTAAAGLTLPPLPSLTDRID